MSRIGGIVIILINNPININYEAKITLDIDKKILVQCDFDGTVTTEDVSFMLLDVFAQGDWHAINDEYADGKISVGEFNERAFALVRAGKKEMLDYLKNKVVIRPGFKSFVQLCCKKEFRLVIVSNGLDFYVRQILTDIGLDNLEFHASETRFHANRLKVRYVGPDGRDVNSDFKDKYVSHFVGEGYKVVYIGNGSSDLSPAKGANQIFATESLLEQCQRTGLNCIPFTSFLEINQVISTW
jgi:2-hydroxy-3-keto-5-methylthiopentenyl-1-phosphate phosphatase